MKKIFLLLILLPFFGLSQKLNFTTEEEEFVTQVIERVEENNFTSTYALLKELENALEKVNYHPKLVYALLNIKFHQEQNTFFVSNYCKQLDDEYLTQNQNILVDLCAYSYINENDLVSLFNISNLVYDKNIKDLYLAYYSLNSGNTDGFVSYCMSSMSYDFNYPMMTKLRGFIYDYLITYLASIKDDATLNTIINDYEDALFSTKLSLESLLYLIQIAIFNEDFSKAEELISYTLVLFPENYKYMHPAKAFLYSSKGDKTQAVEAFENSLKMDDDAFEKVLNTNSGEINIFPFYILSLYHLNDFDTKEKLVNEMLSYFENHKIFKIKTKLYQSLMYATKNYEKAKSILDESATHISYQNYQELDYLLKIENEHKKTNPDHKLIDQLLKDFVKIEDLAEFKKIKINYKVEINKEKKQAFFDADEIIEDIDELLKMPLDENDKLIYKLLQIMIISINDLERANIELNKLPLEESEKQNILKQAFEDIDFKNANKSTNQYTSEDTYFGIDYIKVIFLNRMKVK